jgi:hypothetical protein
VSEIPEEEGDGADIVVNNSVSSAGNNANHVAKKKPPTTFKILKVRGGKTIDTKEEAETASFLSDQILEVTSPRDKGTAAGAPLM